MEENRRFVFVIGSPRAACDSTKRLPTLEELQGIVDYADASSPVPYTSFDSGCSASCTVTTCSCTAPSLYWTSDLVASISGNAWTIDFTDGSALTDTRDTDYSARGVRDLP